MKQSGKSTGIAQSAGDRAFDMVAVIAILLVTISVVYPLYFVVIASLSDPTAINTGKVLLLPKSPGMEAYRKILSDNRIWSGYANTLFYTAGVTLLGGSATLLAGYALSRKDLVGRGIILKLFVFTMYFSGGLIPSYIVAKNLNLTNSRSGLVLICGFTVFNLIIAKTFFETTIPDELLEAAQIDGCGNGRFFFSVALPLSSSIIAVVALYYAVAEWNSFFRPLIYLNDQGLYPLQLILRDILIGSQLIQSDMADLESINETQKLAETIKYGVIVVSSLPILAAYPFVQKYFVRGVMIGAVKG